MFPPLFLIILSILIEPFNSEFQDSVFAIDSYLENSTKFEVELSLRDQQNKDEDSLKCSNLPNIVEIQRRLSKESNKSPQFLTNYDSGINHIFLNQYSCKDHCLEIKASFDFYLRQNFLTGDLDTWKEDFKKSIKQALCQSVGINDSILRSQTSLKIRKSNNKFFIADESSQLMEEILDRKRMDRLMKEVEKQMMKEQQQTKSNTQDSKNLLKTSSLPAAKNLQQLKKSSIKSKSNDNNLLPENDLKDLLQEIFLINEQVDAQDFQEHEVLNGQEQNTDDQIHRALLIKPYDQIRKRFINFDLILKKVIDRLRFDYNTVKTALTKRGFAVDYL